MANCYFLNIQRMILNKFLLRGIFEIEATNPVSGNPQFFTNECRITTTNKNVDLSTKLCNYLTLIIIMTLLLSHKRVSLWVKGSKIVPNITMSPSFFLRCCVGCDLNLMHVLDVIWTLCMCWLMKIPMLTDFQSFSTSVIIHSVTHCFITLFNSLN